MMNALSVGLVLLALHTCSSFSPALAPLRLGAAPHTAHIPGKRGSWTLSSECGSNPAHIPGKRTAGRAAPALGLPRNRCTGTLGLRASGEGGAGEGGEEARAKAANEAAGQTAASARAEAAGQISKFELKRIAGLKYGWGDPAP